MSTRYFFFAARNDDTFVTGVTLIRPGEKTDDAIEITDGAFSAVIETEDGIIAAGKLGILQAERYFIRLDLDRRELKPNLAGVVYRFTAPEKGATR